MELRYGLSAAFLKSLAALFMLVDHAGIAFPQLALRPGAARRIWTFCPGLIGRLSFPIFAYFLAEGCRRTHFFPAICSGWACLPFSPKFPFTLSSPALWGGSVMLTFFLSACAVCGFEQFAGGENRRSRMAATTPVYRLRTGSASEHGLRLSTVLCWSSPSISAVRTEKRLLCLGVGLALFYLIYLPLGAAVGRSTRRHSRRAGYAYLRQTMPAAW